MNLFILLYILMNLFRHPPSYHKNSYPIYNNENISKINENITNFNYINNILNPSFFHYQYY